MSGLKAVACWLLFKLEKRVVQGEIDRSLLAIKEDHDEDRERNICEVFDHNA